jgi:hypothetical protein
MAGAHQACGARLQELLGLLHYMRKILFEPDDLKDPTRI